MKAKKKVGRFDEFLLFLKENRKKLTLIFVPIIVLTGVVLGLIFIGGVRTAFKFDNITEKIVLPSGFRIETFASDLGGSIVSYPGPNPGPRMMLLKDKVLFVTIPSQGKVVALPDTNGANIGDRQITFISGLNNPHGIDFINGSFYIAEENRVIRVRDDNNDLVAD